MKYVSLNPTAAFKVARWPVMQTVHSQQCSVICKALYWYCRFHIWVRGCKFLWNKEARGKWQYDEPNLQWRLNVTKLVWYKYLQFKFRIFVSASQRIVSEIISPNCVMIWFQDMTRASNQLIIIEIMPRLQFLHNSILRLGDYKKFIQFIWINIW